MGVVLVRRTAAVGLLVGVLACGGKASAPGWPEQGLPLAHGQVLTSAEEVIVVAYPGDLDTRELLGQWRAGLQNQGWECEPPLEVVGQGWRAGCDQEGRRHHVLGVTLLRDRITVSMAPQHPHAGGPGHR